MAERYTVNIFGQIDLSKVNDPESKFLNFNNESSSILNPYYYNTTFEIIKSYVDTNSKLVISSNGIDGFGQQDTTFNIDKNKFVNSKIFFTIRVKTSTDQPIKNVSLLDYNDLTLYIKDENNAPLSGVTFYDNMGALSALDQGGFFKGYFVSTLTASNVHITASTTVSSVTLSGESNTFNIYPVLGVYDIRKVNENNDQKNQYKRMALQHILQDNPGFFDDFLGQIVGDSTSNPNTLGIKVFEKISNFVSNNIDITYANLDQFLNMLDEVGTEYDKYNLQYPPSLKRLIDIFSIPLSNQIGSTNKYAYNFDDKGYTDGRYYGINKGSELDFNTTVLYNNPYNNYTQFLAYEKFSGKYTLLNSLLPNITSYDFTIYDYSQIICSCAGTAPGINGIWNRTSTTSVSGRYFYNKEFGVLVKYSLLWLPLSNPQWRVIYSYRASVASSYTNVTVASGDGYAETPGAVSVWNALPGYTAAVAGLTFTDVTLGVGNSFHTANYDLSGYPLSSYRDNWGWGLVLPTDTIGSDITKYYTFFEYVSTQEGTNVQKFIDFDNTNNTYLNSCTSYNQYADKDGIIDNILIHHLYTNVGIISST